MSSEQRAELLSKIDTALEDIRPHLAVDGGNVEVVDVTDDMTVKVKWLGSCQACTMSTMTLKAGVEQTIKGKIPEIHAVEAVNGVG
ncbi:MAG: NifU family protein [Bacteroidota bacterium]